MDDSPADADSQPGSLPPYPYRAPDGEQRPLPDAVAIRLVAIPDFNPPFDDELPGAWNPGLRVNQIWAGDGPAPHMPNMNDELATGRYGPYSAAWREVRTTNHHRAGDPLPMWKPACERAAEPTADHQASGDQASGDRPSDGRKGKDQGDDIGPWPSQFAQVLAEILAGARPASQLTPWTTEQARTHIRRLGPLLAAERRPRVQRVRASRPARNVVEVAVIAEFGSRTRALAARLERAAAQPATPGRPGREARWLCTAIESA